MKPVSGLIIGQRYELLGELAAGGMGSVWRARHVELEVDVAVKFMAERLASSTVGRARFKREARAAAQLRSPHVTQILDYGVEDGVPYIAMELLEGEDLRQLLKRKGSLSLARCVELTEQLVRGLTLAHGAGIVHRDLKPSNVFIQRIGDQSIVKVLDFGVAKDTKLILAEGEGTQSGALVGSPRYMSPEQAQGEAVDPRSDLWSLGAMLYEMATGQPAFNSSHLGQLFTRICQADYTPASMVLKRLPPATDAFFRRALQPEPERRFQSAVELLDGLRTIASFDPDRGPLVHADTTLDRPVPRADRTAELITPSGATPAERVSDGGDAAGAPAPGARDIAAIDSVSAVSAEVSVAGAADPAPSSTQPSERDVVAPAARGDSPADEAGVSPGVADVSLSSLSDMGAQQLPVRAVGPGRRVWLAAAVLGVAGAVALALSFSSGSDPSERSAAADSATPTAADVDPVAAVSVAPTASSSSRSAQPHASAAPSTSVEAGPIAAPPLSAAASSSAAPAPTTLRPAPWRPPPPRASAAPAPRPLGLDPHFGVDPNK